jgi:hypothetical protein
MITAHHRRQAARLLLTTVCPLFAAGSVSAQLGDLSSEVFEFQEWTLTTGSAPANPYEVDATATFTPVDGGAALETGVFYDGIDGSGQHVYKFRFTGIEAGQTYNVATSGDLGVQTGSFTVAPNANGNATGFLTNVGNKFARQVGNDGQVRGELFNVYMNLTAYNTEQLTTLADESTRQAYFDEVKANGSNAAFVALNNEWFELGTQKRIELTGTGPFNPDLDTFAILEETIQHARREGVHLHMWAWGDDSSRRRWTPPGDDKSLDVNGTNDRRLQEYIADRLAPLPGWSMGYGFDLNEWTDDSEINDWAGFVQSESTRDHLLFARHYAASDGPDVNNGGGGNSRRADNLSGHSYATETDFDGSGNPRPEGPGLETTPLGPTGYAEIVSDLRAGPDKPHLYEERFTFNRSNGYWNQDRTRQFHWLGAIAGGVGNWWGFFPKSPGEPDAPVDGGYPEPLRTQLQTFRTFWTDNNRLKLDMEPANEITGNTVLDGGSDTLQYVLLSEAEDLAVVYAEETDTITLNLSQIDDPDFAAGVKLTLVDVLASYDEIDLGGFALEDIVLDLNNYDLPGDATSDWALVITPIPEPSTAAVGLVTGLVLTARRRRCN